MLWDSSVLNNIVSKSTSAREMLVDFFVKLKKRSMNDGKYSWKHALTSIGESLIINCKIGGG